MKKGWKEHRLVDVCELITCGVAARPKYVDSGIPFLSAKNVKNGTIIYDGYNCVSLGTHKELTKNNKPLPGDILYTRVGSYGEAAVIESDIEFSIFVSLTLIKPMKRMLDSYFLKYYLNSNEVKSLAKSSINSSGVGNLNVGTVRQFPIPIPPLPEQQRIVSILDEAFEAIDQAKANTEKNLQNARELFQSELNRIFTNKGEGWVEKKLKEIGATQTGTTPKTSEKENYGDYIPFIKPADVDFSGAGDIRFDNDGLSEIGLKRGRLIGKGSILMVCIGATIGKVGYSELDVSCNQQINTLTPDKEFDSKFFYYGLASKNFQDRVLSEGKGAQATLPIINKSKWENLTISFPKSKSEQQRIVSQLDMLLVETKQLEANYQKKLNGLEELKKSILQKAFSGELTRETTEIQMKQLDMVAEEQAMYNPNQ